MNAVTSEKLSLQLSAEHAEDELTEQKRLTESLRTVSSLLCSCSCSSLLYLHPNTEAHCCILFRVDYDFGVIGVRNQLNRLSHVISQKSFRVCGWGQKLIFLVGFSALISLKFFGTVDWATERVSGL